MALEHGEDADILSLYEIDGAIGTPKRLAHVVAANLGNHSTGQGERRHTLPTPNRLSDHVGGRSARSNTQATDPEVAQQEAPAAENPDTVSRFSSRDRTSFVALGPRNGQRRRVAVRARAGDTLVAIAIASAGFGSCARTASAPGTLVERADVPARTQAGAVSSDSAAVTDWANEIHSPAGLVLVHGTEVVSWGDVTRKLPIASCRKSLLSALFGIAIQRGTIEPSKTLADLGIDDTAPALTEEEKRATIFDLLSSRSGVYHPASIEAPWQQRTRPARGSHEHGTFWYYNNWDFNVLGAIYEALTGASICEAFDKNIAKPIGMVDYKSSDCWHFFDANSRYPGYPFKLSTRDMARFGQLYLQRGRWHGVQVVSEDWVVQSTTARSDVPWSEGGGYGFLWWTGGSGTGLFRGVNLGPSAFAAEGYGGHYIVVAPAFDLVCAVRADDAWFDADPDHRNIGPQRGGELLSRILRFIAPKESVVHP